MKNYDRIGKENATYQELISLWDNRTKRTQKQKFFVEGVQGLKDAIKNQWQIDSLIFTEFEKLSEWSKNIIINTNCKKYLISSELMNKLSTKTDKSELVAVINMKNETFNIKSNENPLILLVDRPSKKENFGNIIRSADAFGVDYIFVTGHSVDIYDPVIIRASMGSFFKMKIFILKSNEEITNLYNLIKSKFTSSQFIATSLQSYNDISDINFTKPTVLMIGNESEGLNKFLNGLADKSAKINMRKGIDSLNIASATSIFLFTAYYQRKNFKNLWIIFIYTHNIVL